jgi:hypothetical protein
MGKEVLTFRQSDHYNGGREWFGYGGECRQHPRIYLLTRSFRSSRTTEYEYSVDGEKVRDLAAALERIKSPPIVADDERAALHLVSTDWSERHAWKSWEGGYSMAHQLRRKGLIEADDGRIRLTELGRALQPTAPGADRDAASPAPKSGEKA